jgi:hypothetical protein
LSAFREHDAGVTPIAARPGGHHPWFIATPAAFARAHHVYLDADGYAELDPETRQQLLDDLADYGCPVDVATTDPATSLPVPLLNLVACTCKARVWGVAWSGNGSGSRSGLPSPKTRSRPGRSSPEGSRSLGTPGLAVCKGRVSRADD